MFTADTGWPLFASLIIAMSFSGMIGYAFTQGLERVVKFLDRND